ncbi:MAG: peptidylprolyl isomerase [Burkholderiales bacterium]
MDLSYAQRITARLVIATCCLATPCYSAAEIVARLGNTEITASDIKTLLSDNASAKGAITFDQLSQLVKGEALRRALLSEATDKGWAGRKEVIAAMEQAREQALLRAYINELTSPPANYPPEGDIKTMYDSNKSSFTVPRLYRISHIFVAAGTDPAKAKDRVEELARKASENPAKFADLAKANSEDKASAARGGDIGWLKEDDFLPELKKTVLSMSKGSVSKPVKTERGWHIVQLVDQRAPGTRSLAEVRDQIARALRVQKAQENERNYLKEMLKKTPVKVDEQALTKLHESLK